MNQTVSVIIPVLNAASMLQEVLEALSIQSYPAELTEIIVVDNGSSDSSPEVAQSFGVKVLAETEKKSPYAARNLGFSEAAGSIIALTDANKVPDKFWIEEGVKSLTEENADLAGGHILFDLGENPTGAEIFDAITYNNNKAFVTERGCSASGNLFFRRGVMEKTGPFPDDFRSGMDIWWTQNAVQKGYKLVFSEKSIVYCKPRKLKSVLKKSWRVGILHPVIFKKEGGSFLYILGQTLRTFAPPKIKPLKNKISDLNQPVSLVNIWTISWMSKVMMGFGRIRGLTNVNRKIQGKSANS